MANSKTMWGMHMELHHEMKAVEQGFLSVGWEALGDLSKIAPTREAFKKTFATHFPTNKPGAIPVRAGILYRFAVEMTRGDYVVYPSKPDRMINLGIIDGEYHYDPNADPKSHHRRKVKWLRSPPGIFRSGNPFPIETY